MMLKVLLCVLSVYLTLCYGQGACTDSLNGTCPSDLYGKWRVYEIQRTGEPILTNPIILNWMPGLLVFNSTATGEVTGAQERGCSLDNGVYLGDNMILKINVTIRSIVRVESVTRARQVSNSPGLCAYPDSFAVPIASPFWRMYVWNRVCASDQEFACPDWLQGKWDLTEYVNDTTAFSEKKHYYFTGDRQQLLDSSGNVKEEYIIHCGNVQANSVWLRTLTVSPMDQFGGETRSYIEKTETGFTQIINYSGNCTFPTAQDGVSYNKLVATAAQAKTTNIAPIVGGIVGGVGGLLLLISIIVIVVVMKRRKKSKLEKKRREEEEKRREAHESNKSRDKQSVGGDSTEGYSIPVELMALKKQGYHGSYVAADRSWEIDFNELILEEEIGAGSFGVVWKGQWRNTEVAIKQMKGHMTDRQMNEFQAEAGLLGKLRPHNNVMLFLGVCTQPYPCIITELLSGGSVYEILKDHDIKYERKLKIAKDVCSGMTHLHSENIIHRDLAARNVLLTDNGTAKIADFGMSRVMETADGGTTLSGIGPVKWMAPEALNERKYSVQSDMWSFGVTLWEFFSRKEPFARLDATQAAIQIARDGLRLSRPENTPDQIWEIMHSCWAETPENRPTFNYLYNEFAGMLSSM